MIVSPPLIDIKAVVKAYPALRPLRVKALSAGQTDRIVLRGFDEGAAEMFIHLVTGASVPDEGTISIAGRLTTEIATDTEWLTSLDRFGIVTNRAVLIDKLSLVSNLALPLTVSIDPVPPDIRVKVEALATEAGFDLSQLDRDVAELNEEQRLRLHLARAIANGPELVLLEHPTARLGDNRAAAERVGHTLASLADARGFGWLALTEDEAFATAAAGRVLALNAATGELAEPRRGWRKMLGFT